MKRKRSTSMVLQAVALLPLLIVFGAAWAWMEGPALDGGTFLEYLAASFIIVTSVVLFIGVFLLILAALVMSLDGE